MPFIQVYPLEEMGGFDPTHLGLGHPARCRATTYFAACSVAVAVHAIAAYEECPLYLVSSAEDNALVNGIRLRLLSGEVLVLADDPEDEADAFVHLLERAAGGKVVAMPFSRYLRRLEKAGKEESG